MLPKKHIIVREAGFCSTLQDLGRFGYQAYGVSECGALDKEAASIANWLVSKPANSTVIEATSAGLELEFSADMYIALSGADNGAQLNGASIPLYESIAVKAGAILKLTAQRDGIYSYIAVSGEILCPRVMNSTATCLRSAFGGYEGRRLVAGDRIGVKIHSCKHKTLDSGLRRTYGRTNLRVLLNRQLEQFCGAAFSNLLSSQYSITAKSDRMAYRLAGTALRHTKGADILSTAVNFGSIQVPGDCQPIIMLADRQTVGGYAQIGRVISLDHSFLVQAMPGSTVFFQECSLHEAQRLYRKRLHDLQNAIK